MTKSDLKHWMGDISPFSHKAEFHGACALREDQDIASYAPIQNKLQGT